MIVYHATHRRNVPGILKHGLLVSLHQLKTPAVWVYARGDHSWAIVHMLTRHGAGVEDVVILSLRVPDSWLVHSHRPRLFAVKRDIPPHRIRSVRSFALALTRFQGSN